MEENILAFLEGIHVDDSVIEKLRGEEKLDEDAIESATNSYIDSRDKYYESQNLSRIQSDARKGGISASGINVRKKLNKLFGLGLSNSQMDEFADNMDGYYKIAGKSFQDKMDALKEDSSQATRDEITELRNSLSTSEEENISLRDGMENFQTNLANEYETKRTKDRALSAYRNYVADDRKNLVSDLPGDTLDRLLKSYENETFEKYKVSEDLSVLNPDGTPAKHPDPGIKRTVKSAKDIHDWQVRDLIKKNNAGKAPKILEDSRVISLQETKEQKPLSPEAREKYERYAKQGADVFIPGQ